MIEQVNKFEEYHGAWSDFDIYISSAKLYSVGMEAYCNKMSVQIFNRIHNYQVHHPHPALVSALDLWWTTFRNTIELAPYLREVLGNEI